MKTVLFVGNSFTYYNDLPAMVTQLSGGRLVCAGVTKGGAFAHQYADPDHELGQSLRTALQTGSWNWVVLQDQSFNPVGDPDDCGAAMAVLCRLTPDSHHCFYQTWAYRDGSEKLKRTGLTYEQMYTQLKSTYARCAKDNGGTLAPVGDGFRAVKAQNPQIELYDADCYHPSEAGTYLAACVFCAVLGRLDVEKLPDIPQLEGAVCEKLRRAVRSVLEGR